MHLILEVSYFENVRLLVQVNTNKKPLIHKPISDNGFKI